MANSERQVTGAGPGATDEPFYQMAIPTPNEGHIKSGNIRKPFELDHVNQRIFDIFEKLLDLKSEFERAESNISVTESQKVALEKATRRLDIINRKLIEIPDFLTIFKVDI